MTGRVFLAAALAALASAPGAYASALSMTCAFDHRCGAEQGCGATELSMIFHFDDATGAAFVIGNNGVAEVQVIEGPDATSFVERLPSGAVQVTVIDRIGLHAVHSRNTVPEGGAIEPSQYYGACKAGG